MKNKEEEIVPFEWLTNFSSLSKLFDPSYLFTSNLENGIPRREEDEEEIASEKTTKDCNNLRKLKVLHVGCGSSTLGESLIRRYEEYDTVINVDNDNAVLNGMRRRWAKFLEKWRADSGQDISSKKCLWKHLDFNRVQMLEDFNDEKKDEDEDFLRLDKNSFDLVVDKSTLDCALCSDDATSGLIYNAYNSLKPDGGVYFVISFHHTDFILPMLKDCPGLDWDVKHFIVPRKVDTPSDLESQNKNFAIENYRDSHEFQETTDSKSKHSSSHEEHQPSWSNVDGIFKPNESYGKFVNVFICKRKMYQPQCEPILSLDRDAMRKHIHDCNDLHYKNHNPMVTHVRKEQIKSRFLENLKLKPKRTESHEMNTIQEDALLENGELELRVCYDILFTNAEKEHLLFEYFLEDYEAFSKMKQYSKCSGKGMNMKQAIAFLETMQ